MHCIQHDRREGFTLSSWTKKASSPTHPCESPLLEPLLPHQLTMAYEMPLLYGMSGGDIARCTDHLLDISCSD